MNIITKEVVLMKKIFKLVLFIVICSSIYMIFNKGEVSLGGSEKIIENPNISSYDIVSMEKKDISRGNLILVNNKVDYDFSYGEDLEALYDMKTSTYKVSGMDLLIKNTVGEALNEMLGAFHKKYKDNSVIVVSGYRTYDFQKQLLDDEIRNVGAEEAAKWVAKPGGSEHHTGLAVDFNLFYDDGTSDKYTGEGNYKWINENAHSYGFVVRYPEHKSNLTGISYEPWHFRYVGEPHAKIMKEKDMCLEEYVDYIKEFEVGKKHLVVEGSNGKGYEIYFTKELEVLVPSNREYSISGNNIDGFIVTVER